MKYITILYSQEQPAKKVNDKVAITPGVNKFDIQEHEVLASAVKYLVKHGANYDEQLIVTEVNWMPSEGQDAVTKDNPSSAPVKDNKPTPRDPGPPAHAKAANPNDPDMQPKEMDMSGPGGSGGSHANPGGGPGRPLSISERMNGIRQPGKKKSIFEGLVHPSLIPQIQNAD